MVRGFLAGAAVAALLAVPALGAPAPTPAPDAAAAAPSVEAAALGRSLAATSDFQALANAVVTREIGEIQHDTPGLTAEEKGKVAAIGRAKFNAGFGVVLDRLGDIYAATFSVADLKVMVDFFASPAGRAYTGRYATTMPQLAKALAGFDFKAETLKGLCAETGKGCSTGKDASKKP